MYEYMNLYFSFECTRVNKFSVIETVFLGGYLSRLGTFKERKILNENNHRTKMYKFFSLYLM